MVMSIQEPFISKEVDGKKMKKKKSNLENDNKVTELNGSLKEENDVTRDKKKKKKQKKDKIVTESIDEDEKKLDSKSVLPEEETTDKKKKKKDKNELKEAENDVDVTEHKKKKKKKKDKVVTESINGDERESNIKSGLPEENTKTSPSEETRDTKYEKKKKEKKKKSEVDVSLKEENDVQMTEAEDDVEVTKHKKKKQKKNKLVIDSIDGDEKKSDVPSEDTTNTKDKKEKKKKTKKETEETKSFEPLDIGADNNQMSKKRKRSDELEVQPAEETIVNDSKRRKSEGLEVNSKQIVANGETTGNDLSKLSKNGPDKSGQKQQRNDSAEPKTVHAFQRVKIDEVEFVDDRLQDNSYWAKSGAEKGYGAKAQEILGQVKGRDFRHEKTKKKRGSYRGGLIDQHSHSIKFNYSDEE